LGTGGTLSADGKAYGRYYRKQFAKKGFTNPVLTPGRVGYNAVLLEQPVSIDYYAVFKAVQGFQRWMGTPATGLFDRTTRDAVKVWQGEQGLVQDGIFGPATARKLFEPVILSEAKKLDPEHATLGAITVGHCNWESGWDPGAVGGVSPQDLGLFQINGPSHPEMSVDQRLTPLPSIKWAVNFVRGNLAEFDYDTDAGIAAYNLGKGGTRNCIKDGRPDIWTRTVDGKESTTEVRRYINEIKKGAGLPV
jgi:peptidoglycan hydrolase-like protein with peptidoglycan-binding domain